MGTCDVKVCRICFATECQLYTMTAYQILYETYKTLTGLLLEDEHNLPLCVCSECSRQLLNSARLRSKSLRAHVILLEIVKKQDCITIDSIRSAIEVQNSLGLYLTHAETDSYELDMKNLEDSLENDGQIDAKHIPDLDKDLEESLKSNEQTDTRNVPELDENFPVDGVKLKNEVFDDVVKEDNVNLVAIDISSLQDDIKVEVMKANGDDEDDEGGDNDFAGCSLDVKEESCEFEEHDVHADGFPDENRSSDNNRTIEVLTQKAINKKAQDTKKLWKDFYVKSDPYKLQGDCELDVDKKFSCNICPFKAFSEAQLSSHLEGHDDTNLYKCNFKTIKNTQLSSYRKIHSGKEPYSCEVCNKSFKQKFRLVFHLKTHSGEKPYSCDICEKSFTLKCNLLSHLRLHSSERPYLCDVCNKSFRRSDYFKMHKRLHTGVKPFQCDVCKKSFTTKTILKQHLVLHFGGKSYSCEVCFKSFVRKGNLETHMRIHSGEKPYSCGICHKKFSLRNTLRLHLKALHS